MVFPDEKDGEHNIDADVFGRIFEARQRKGIQVKEQGVDPVNG